MKILCGKKYIFYSGDEECTSTAIYYGILIGEWFMGMSWRVKNANE